jgi:hypothetical protein
LSGVYSVTTTQRRRYLWCAWWTGEPTRDPFREPDAWSGGARSEAEAKKAAERAAGRPLREIEPIWARAWVRVCSGRKPWVTHEPRKPRPSPPPREEARRASRIEPVFEGCPFAALGLTPAATPAEIRRAFRTLALTTHPDRGGSPAAFIRVKQAYDAALTRKGARPPHL